MNFRSKVSKKSPKYKLIGVRFATSYRTYTYRIGANKKVYLGQELVAYTHSDPAIVFVVNLKPRPYDGETQLIEHKVAKL